MLPEGIVRRGQEKKYERHTDKENSESKMQKNEKSTAAPQKMSSSTTSNDDHYVVLNDGQKMPVLALGTFSPDVVRDVIVTKTAAAEETGVFKEVKDATQIAIDVGYRHVDCAYTYQGEAAVGAAFREKIAQGIVKREDLFFTTKLWSTFHRPHLVRTALENALNAFNLDYIDLYIIHTPVSLQPGDDTLPLHENGDAMLDSVDLRQTWEALEECKDAGLVKSIGVSNFTRQQLEMILNKPELKYKPAVNQVEFHPYLTKKNLLEFCKTNNIIMQAYGVLGSPGAESWRDANLPSLLKDPVLISIGEKYQKSPAQVSIRWTIQKGVAPVIKSFNSDRIKQNFQVFDFILSAEDMKSIDKLNKDLCYWHQPMFEKHPNYSFNNVD